MSGKSLFVDTNTVLYFLAGESQLGELLDKRPIYLSFITELELLRFKNLDEQEELRVRAFLEAVTIIDINSEIKRIVVELGKKYKLKLPDLIIVSSALFCGLPLLTADKQLSTVEEVNVLELER